MALTKEASLSGRLAYLSEILITFSTSPIPSHLLQTLADYAEGVLSYDFLALALLDPEHDGYLVHSLGGDTSVQVSSQLYPLQKGLVGHVINSGKPAIVYDFETAPEQIGLLEQQLVRFGFTAALVIPVRQGGNKIGALLFTAYPSHPYNEDDQQIAMLLASGLAANLEMSRLYQTLADEQSTLKAVVESAQEGVIVVNPAGIVLMANPAFHGMFQKLESELTGYPFLDVIENEQLQQLFMRGEAHSSEITLADGRLVEASLESVISRYGEHIGWAAVLHDITLLKELARMKDDFVNTVSHDLKNPISSILLAIDMLERLGDLNDAQQNLQGRIRGTAHYMNELVTDLLDLGKIGAGLGLQMTTFNLANLLKEIEFALIAHVEDKQITLQVQHANVSDVTADRSRLRQVLLNLIGNAIKYTPPKGCVTVSVSSLNEQVQIMIQDTGFGIPAADLPHIFDKFYRVHTDDTADIKGTGLGLAITKSIIEAHEGEIRVHSKHKQGSTFTVLLPRSPLTS